ncbi:MAG: VPS10 domain-containing protein [Candidatus Acidiferrales bacterium]
MKIFSWRASLSLLVFCPLLLVASPLAAQKKGKKNLAPEVKQEAASAQSAAAPASAAPTLDTALENLKLREIGPAIMGGRIDDIAVNERDPNTAYFGAATGGVWKTTNGGDTWEPVFDHEGTSTIGAIALAPSDPSILWVGTGEQNNRQSSSWGDGVYKSADGGKTWAHLGLEATQHIGKILIHPTNPDVVYVAALGHLWGPNPERGLYRTSDGGKTWAKVLSINDDTGVVDLAMDPVSPDTLYAAAYERRRTAWGYSGGGPGSAIYKTTDGGAHWTKLTKGLPDGDDGRIGLAVYPRNANIVYARIENKNGGIFRSEDKGETWTKMGSTNPRPSYFSRIVVDPNNDLRIWVLGADMYYSEDGGKNFRTDWVKNVHSDFHTLWLDPSDSRHIWAGCDGGMYTSHDGGKSWESVNTIALGQFYEVGFDMRQPYTICGGLQDNAEWCGPSQTWFTSGITNDDWFRVGGGDGFYVKPDPADPLTVYEESQDGNMARRDLRSNEARLIRPKEKEGDPPYRFNWNSPLIISAHDPKTIYYGGNFLFKSTDRGDTWTRLGGDLTTGVDRNKLAILGKTPSKDTLSLNDGVAWWPTITSISESPESSAVLWVGTDDGNLQVSRDGGETWKSVADRVPGVPKGTYVSRVVTSKYAEGAAYVCFDGHRSDDFHVYLFYTSDYGDSWQSVAGDLPQDNGILHVVREDLQNPAILFAGTETGAYWSNDRGAHWHRFKMNLPTVPVDDIQIHPRENDLIFGTHGRSIWIFDDITPLEDLNDKLLSSDLSVLPIRPAVEWRMYSNDWFLAQKHFLGSNPPYGALIDFYLKSAPPEKPAEKDKDDAKDADKDKEKEKAVQKVKITISDKDGKRVRQLEVEAHAGINRVAWDLRYDPPTELTAEQRAAQAQGFFNGGSRGPAVEPGTYTVNVALGSSTGSETVKVVEDPRISISDADRSARHDAIMQLYAMVKTADEGRKTIVALKNSLDSARDSWKKSDAPKIPEAIQQQAEALSKKIEEIHAKFVPPERTLGFAGAPLVYTPPPLPMRIGRLMFEISGYTAAPTSAEKEELDNLSNSLNQEMAALDKLQKEDVAALNKALNDAGVPRITASSGESRGPSRRR